MDQSVMHWALAFGAAIQWFKALPLSGAWGKAQPVLAAGLLILSGYVCEALAWVGPMDWRKFLSDPWTWALISAGVTQATSLAATFGVKVMGLNGDHALVPVTNDPTK